VDTLIDRSLPLPAVTIPGRRRVEGVTNIVLDHRKGAWMALNHLSELGHKEIAFMKGPDVSPDSEDRWKAVCEVAEELGIRMNAELIVQLEGRDATPQLGYPVAAQLLARNFVFHSCLYPPAFGILRHRHDALTTLTSGPADLFHPCARNSIKC
jgi:DNA-binding LacI/PurR family transcriptional regulator